MNNQKTKVNRLSRTSDDLGLTVGRQENQNDCNKCVKDNIGKDV